MVNQLSRYLKSAPKVLVAICAGVILFNIFILFINFKTVAALRFLITLFLLYKVLVGSKTASIILAVCLLVASIFALYPIYFTYQVFGNDVLAAGPAIFYIKLLGFSIPSFLCVLSAYYIFTSNEVKKHHTP